MFGETPPDISEVEGEYEVSADYDWGQDRIRSQPSTAETKGFSPITTEKTMSRAKEVMM